MECWFKGNRIICKYTHFKFDKFFVYPSLSEIFFSFIFINWRLITLQYCVVFAIQWCESPMDLHMFPILIPAPPHLPPHSISLGLPSAPTLSTCLKHLTWAGDLFHTWQYTCFNAILSAHPTLAFSHRVQKSVLYICVSFFVLDIGLSLPSF